MPTPLARINPELLVWARRTVGLSPVEAARKIQTDPQRLESWEAGEAMPTIAQLRKAAKAYRRPMGVFYLPQPPVDFMPITDYRRLPEADRGLSSALLMEIRRSQEQREIHLELLAELGDEPPRPSTTLANTTEDPEVVGGRVREILGIDLEEQFRWRDQYQALNAWVEVVEHVGYLVLQTSGVSLDEMRGFSIVEDTFPTIVLNGSDSPNGRIFTLLHEVAHVQLSLSGVCDLHERGERAADQTEVFCNRVAAAVLMPRESFQRDPRVARFRGDQWWPDEELARLARLYSVSREAVLRRLLTFGNVSVDYYRTRRAEFLQAYELQRAERAGFAPVAAMRVRDLGRPYVRTLLDAYHQRQITAADLSRLLGARLKHLPRIEAALGREP